MLRTATGHFLVPVLLDIVWDYLLSRALKHCGLFLSDSSESDSLLKYRNSEVLALGKQTVNVLVNNMQL